MTEITLPFMRYLSLSSHPEMSRWSEETGVFLPVWRRVKEQDRLTAPMTAIFQSEADAVAFKLRWL